VRSRAIDTLARGASLRDAGALLRRRWWLVLACVVLIPGAIYVANARDARTYQASAILQPADSQASGSGQDQFSIQPDTDAVRGFVQLGQVAGATLKGLHAPYGSVGGLTSSVDDRTGWITLTATATTPRLAIDAANAYAAAVVNYARVDFARQLQSAITAARQALAIAREPSQRAQIKAGLLNLKSTLRATTAQIPVVTATSASVASPHPVRNAFLAFILALLLTPPLVVLSGRLDRTLRRPSELERLSGSTLLAQIPRERSKPGGVGPQTESAFDRLRDSLVFFDPDRPADTVAVVSPLGEEGRTTVITGLARAFARGGRRVAVVDADLHRPSVADCFGVPPEPGLTDVLAGHPLDDAISVLDDFGAEAAVLPAGSVSGGPWELPATDEISRVLEQLAECYDFVLIDTAPLLASSDTLGLVARASGVVAVARLDHTRRDAVRRMTRLMRDAHGRLLGVVATGTRPDRVSAETSQPAGAPAIIGG